MSGHARIWGAGEAHPTTAQREQSALPAPRVLVIDGDNLHRMIICRAADKAGYVPVDVGMLRYVLEQLRVQGALQRGLATA